MLVHAEHWICAIFLMIAIPLSSRTAGQEILEPVQIVTAQWKPYTDATDPEKGIAAQVLTAVFKEMGMQTNYTFMPFDKAMRIAADSQYNDGVRGVFPLYYEPSRQRIFYYSDPLFPVTLKLYYNDLKSPQLNQVKRLSDIKDINAVFIESYRYPDALEKRFSQREREEVDNGFQAIQHLLDEKNKPCLVPMAEKVANSVISDYFPDKAYVIKAIPDPNLQFEMQLYFLASCRNPHNRNFIYDNFNFALRSLKKEGVVDAILSRAQYKSLRQSLIRLTPPPGQWPITGKIDPADPNDFFLPRGTKAEVISWGRALLEPQHGFSEDPLVNMSLVRIWNGPLKGMELYVDNRFIELP